MTVKPQPRFYISTLFEYWFLFLVVSVAGLTACSDSGTGGQGLDAGVTPTVTGGGGGSSGDIVHTSVLRPRRAVAILNPIPNSPNLSIGVFPE